ncbi:MAG: O-antigen ligase family protein [Calditrichaceae bacterium]
MPDIAIIMLIILFFLLAAGMAVLSMRYFVVAVFLIVISSWFSALLAPPEAEFAESGTAGIGSLMRVGILFLAGAAGVFRYAKTWPRHKGRIPAHLIFLALFILFALISARYSIDPQITLIRSASFLALFGFLIGLNSWITGKEEFQSTFLAIYWVIVLLIIVNFLSLILLPGRAWWRTDEVRFQGLFDHPNTMGTFCMIAYPFLLWKFTKSGFSGKSVILTLIILLGIMNVLTGSRSSLLAGIFGISLWFTFQKKFVKLSVMMGVSVLLLFAAVQLRPSAFERQEGQGLGSLTGRQDFWEGAYTLLKERPLTGYGYAVEGKIWLDPRYYDPNYTLWSGSARTSLHNGYVSVAVGLGIFGILSWVIIILTPVLRGLKQPAGEYKSVIYALIPTILILNIVETAITGGNSMEAIVFWIMWVMAGKLYVQNNISLMEAVRFYPTETVNE